MERLLKAPGKKRGILGHIRGVGRPHITVVRRPCEYRWADKADWLGEQAETLQW